MEIQFVVLWSGVHGGFLFFLPLILFLSLSNSVLARHLNERHAHGVCQVVG
jgi:hypothetical protein